MASLVAKVNAHHCLQESRLQELRMALSAEGLLSVKKSRCMSTSMGSTLLHTMVSACLRQGKS